MHTSLSSASIIEHQRCDDASATDFGTATTIGSSSPCRTSAISSTQSQSDEDNNDNDNDEDADLPKLTIPTWHTNTWPGRNAAAVNVEAFSRRVGQMREGAEALRVGIMDKGMLRVEIQTHLNDLHVSISQLELQLEESDEVHVAQLCSLRDLRRLLITAESLVVEQIYRRELGLLTTTHSTPSSADIWQQAIQDSERAQRARLNVEHLDLIRARHQLTFERYSQEHRDALARIERDASAARQHNLGPIAKRQRREFLQGLVEDLMCEAEVVKTLRDVLVHHSLRLRERSLIRWRAATSAMAKRLAQLPDSTALRRFTSAVQAQQQRAMRASRHASLVEYGVYKLGMHSCEDDNNDDASDLPVGCAQDLVHCGEAVHDSCAEETSALAIQTDGLSVGGVVSQPTTYHESYRGLVQVSCANECVVELMMMGSCKELDEAIRAEPKLLRTVERVCGLKLATLLRERTELAQSQQRAWVEAFESVSGKYISDLMIVCVLVCCANKYLRWTAVNSFVTQRSSVATAPFKRQFCSRF
jgi:hypothetical protein